MLIFLLKVVSCISSYGTILVPSLAKREADHYIVNLKGRLGSDTTNEEMRTIIDQTHRAAIPEYDDGDRNFRLRTAYFMTSAATHIKAVANSSFFTNLTVSTGPDGVFSQFFSLKLETNATQVTYSLGNGLENYFTLAEPTGWSIVADVDDTIKLTDVNSYPSLFQNSFFKKYVDVPRMPEYFQQLTKLNNSLFHYLTGLPNQMLPAYQPWLETHYPKGEITLGSMALYSEIPLFDYKRFKKTELAKLFSFFPDRKYILLGDNTQSDPEVYGETFETYGDKIKCIFIRKDPIVIKDNFLMQLWMRFTKNKTSRFEKAFKSVPRSRWNVLIFFNVIDF